MQVESKFMNPIINKQPYEQNFSARPTRIIKSDGRLASFKKILRRLATNFEKSGQKV